MRSDPRRLPPSLWAATAPPAPEHVRQLDLIHFSHTDYGFTDHPAVCREMQRRYGQTRSER